MGSPAEAVGTRRTQENKKNWISRQLGADRCNHVSRRHASGDLGAGGPAGRRIASVCSQACSPTLAAGWDSCIPPSCLFETEQLTGWETGGRICTDAACARQTSPGGHGTARGKLERRPAPALKHPAALAAFLHSRSAASIRWFRPAGGSAARPALAVQSGKAQSGCHNDVCQAVCAQDRPATLARLPAVGSTAQQPSPPLATARTKAGVAEYTGTATRLCTAGDGQPAGALPYLPLTHIIPAGPLPSQPHTRVFSAYIECRGRARGGSWPSRAGGGGGNEEIPAAGWLVATM